jgi:hypothetical protein
MKDGKLKSKDFFNVKDDPYITFHSNKIAQTGPHTLDVKGTFTIRGVSKAETLTFTISGNGTGVGDIKEQWPSTVTSTRGTDLSAYSQRPRKTLGFETPASKLQASVASTVLAGSVDQACRYRRSISQIMIVPEQRAQEWTTHSPINDFAFSSKYFLRHRSLTGAQSVARTRRHRRS